MNKKILLPAMAIGTLALVGATYFGIAKASNQTTNRRDEMVQNLAQKLNLDQTKVQQAMDDIRSEHQAARKAEMEINLTKAVSDKVITEAQKQNILQKMSQNQAEPGQHKGEMRQWATDNGIDFTKLKDYGFGQGGRGNGQRGLNR